MGISEQGLSRRGFVGGVGIGGLALGSAMATGVGASAAAEQNKATPAPADLPGAFYLTNVRLESGFEYEGTEVVATKTELKTLRIADGKITEILPAGHTAPSGSVVYDAKGQLMLPTFRDMHIHLDKTYYGGPWKAVRPNPNGVFDRMKEEQVMLPKLLPVAEERTGKMVDLMQSKGTSITRAHSNVDPVVGLKNLEHMQATLSRRKSGLTYEIVAFPQHGLLYSNCEGLMRDAMKTGFVQYVGGLDPSKVDGDMEKSLNTTFQIAVDYNAGIDYHIHEGPPTGPKGIRRILDLTEQAKLQNRVTLSHAYSLASLAPEEGRELFTRMASLGVTLASAVPLGSDVMPLDAMRKCGVDIVCGTDSVIDHWSPFGDCDMLVKANQTAQLYTIGDEFGLNRSLGYATGWAKLPLSDKGEQLWPKAGVEASFNLVPASCSAEAVARIPARSAVVHKGRLIHGSIDKAA
jgi:cytosine/adenosine deaminase-related metal-dependent hydrolase